MEADTAPLESLPQTMSSTSLFTTDMVTSNGGYSSVQQPRKGKGQLREGKPASSHSHCGQVQPVALDAGILSGTGATQTQTLLAGSKQAARTDINQVTTV